MAIMMSLCSELEKLHVIQPEMFPQLPEFPIVLKAHLNQLSGSMDWSCYYKECRYIEN